MTMSVEKAFLLSAAIAFASEAGETTENEITTLLREKYLDEVTEAVGIIAQSFVELMTAESAGKRPTGPTPLALAVVKLLESDI